MVVSAVFLTRRTALLPILTLTAGLANVALNVILIPRIGIMGAAWSTVAGYTILMTGTWIYAGRGFPLRLDLARLGALVGCGLLITVATRLAIGGAPSLGGALVHLAGFLLFADS